MSVSEVKESGRCVHTERKCISENEVLREGHKNRTGENESMRSVHIQKRYHRRAGRKLVKMHSIIRTLMAVQFPYSNISVLVGLPMVTLLVMRTPVI